MQRKSSVWVGAGLFLLVGVLSGCSFAGPITAEKEVPPEAKSPLFEEESPPEETFPIENAGACAGTPFSLYDVQPGDQVGPWTVVSIGQPEGGGPDWDEDHVEVTFQGPVTLEGFYWYDPGDDLDGFPGFSVAREAQHLMPRALEIPPCVTGFWTQDEGFFRPYTGGWARVQIQEFRLVWYPSDMWHLAILKEARVMVSLPLTKAITYSLEGTEETQTFTLVPMEGQPFVIYVPPNWGPHGVNYEEGSALMLVPYRILREEEAVPHAWVQFFWADEGISREEIRSLMEERLQGYTWEKEPVPAPMPWVETYLVGKKGPAGREKVARHYLGTVDSRSLSLLLVLENPEAGDSFGTLADVVIQEAQFLKTGEGLVRR